MHIDEKRLVGLNSIEHYYFKMPQMPLAATMIFFSCASLILGLFKDTSQLFHLGAYTLMYMCIWLSLLTKSSIRSGGVREMLPFLKIISYRKEY